METIKFIASLAFITIVVSIWLAIVLFLTFNMLGLLVAFT